MARFSYALKEDWKSATGVPATWAPGHPKYWDEELAKVLLGARVIALTLTPNNKFVAVGIENKLYVYSVDTQTLVQVLAGHFKNIYSLRFSLQRTQDGGYLLTLYLYSNQIVVLWDLDDDGRNSSLNDNITDGAALATNAAQMVVGRLVEMYGWKPDEKASQLIAEDFKIAMRNAVDIYTLERLTTFKGHLSSFNFPIFSRDRKIIIYLTQNDIT